MPIIAVMGIFRGWLVDSSVTHMMTFGQSVHGTMTGRGLNCGSLKTFPLTLEARRGPTRHASRHIHGYMGLVRGCKPQ